MKRSDFENVGVKRGGADPAPIDEDPNKLSDTEISDEEREKEQDK
jgi:hypothetical protein